MFYQALKMISKKSLLSKGADSKQEVTGFYFKGDINDEFNPALVTLHIYQIMSNVNLISNCSQELKEGKNRWTVYHSVNTFTKGELSEIALKECINTHLKKCQRMSDFDMMFEIIPCLMHTYLKRNNRFSNLYHCTRAMKKHKLSLNLQ